MQAVATICRQRVRRPAVTQLHLHQMPGAVEQCRQLAPVRVPRAAEVAERIILVLKLPAVVLLAHQLARRVGGEDEHCIPLGLALFQQRAAPLGAGGSTSSGEPHIRAGLEIDR